MVWGKLGANYTHDKMRLFMPIEDAFDADTGTEMTFMRHQHDYLKVGMEVIDGVLYVDSAQFMCDIHRLYNAGQGEIHIYIIPDLLDPDAIFLVDPKDAQAHYKAFNTKTDTLRIAPKRAGASGQEKARHQRRKTAVLGECDRDLPPGSTGNILTRRRIPPKMLLESGQPMENVQESQQ